MKTRRKFTVPTRFAALIERSQAQLHEFADVGRNRDPGGRYAQGNEPAKPDDFVAAHAPKRKALVAGGLAAGAGMLAAATPGGRKSLGRIAAGAVRSMAPG